MKDNLDKWSHKWERKKRKTMEKKPERENYQTNSVLKMFSEVLSVTVQKMQNSFEFIHYHRLIVLIKVVTGIPSKDRSFLCFTRENDGVGYKLILIKFPALQFIQ